MEPIANLASYAILAQESQQQQHQHQHQTQSPDQQNPSGSNSNNNNKRKSTTADPSDPNDASSTQQRAKRNRYISIACNECKRRKIKCNGQSPCQRCGNLRLECVYAPNCCTGFRETGEYKELVQQVEELRGQVGWLVETVNALRQGGRDEGARREEEGIDPALQQGSYGAFDGAQDLTGISPELCRPKSHSQVQQQPSFRGPTSSDFNFSVARSSLQTMGITGQAQESGAEDGGSGEGANTSNPSPAGSPPLQLEQAPQYRRGKDPIWLVSRNEALRLCKVYEDEMGLMYPCVSIEKLQAYVNKLYEFMAAVTRNGFVQLGMPGADAIDDEDTNILKMVLAVAMTVEASGRSEQGRKLFEYVQPDIDATLLGSVGVKGIRLLALAAMYEFMRDNEGTSWRIIGLTARLCIELGLHRSSTYLSLSDDSGERTETTLLFWSIYVLDRRWSLGTGMPFALQDGDLDPALPKPGDASPYLNSMISYSALGSKVWRTVASHSSPLSPQNPNDQTQINVDETAYLDYQVVQWHRSIPIHLRFAHPDPHSQTLPPIGPAPSRAARRLRILLYLRRNQMRILIHLPVLHSATSITTHLGLARTAVEVARDSIRVLTHTNQTSDLYRTQQVLFNAFLTSALAVMFLAIAHTPAVFAGEVREEFYMAVELVRGFSRESFVGKRLWKGVRGLKEAAGQIGVKAMQNQGRLGDGGERSAAVAMAGLAGHNVSEDMTLFGQGRSGNGAWNGAGGNSSSPEGIANDLTSLFEAAGGYLALGGGGGGADGLQGQQQQMYHGQGQVGNGGQVDGGIAAMFGGEEGLNGILKELF